MPINFQYHFKDAPINHYIPRDPHHVIKLLPITLFFFNYLFYLFIFGRNGSLLRCTGFSLQWLLLLRSTGSRRPGFSSCGTRAQQLWLTGSSAQAQQLWHTGLVAPQHVGSSRTRAQTCVSCIGRRILNHCATREAPQNVVLNSTYKTKCTSVIFLSLYFILFPEYSRILKFTYYFKDN